MNLHVKVVEARDLPKMDTFGKADPYCLLQVSGSKKLERTKVIDKTYTPRWNENFSFPVPSLAETLHLLMKDRDRGSEDDPMSKLEIPLNTLVKGQVTDKWYDLRPFPGVKKGGQIRLGLHLCDANQTAWIDTSKNLQQRPLQQRMPMQQPYNPMMGAQPMMQQQYPMQQPMMQQQYPMQQPMMQQQYPMQQPMMQPYVQPQPMMMQPGMQPMVMQPGMQSYPMQQPMQQPYMQQPPRRY
jgi:hypothetical protein